MDGEGSVGRLVKSELVPEEVCVFVVCMYLFRVTQTSTHDLCTSGSLVLVKPPSKPPNEYHRTNDNHKQAALPTMLTLLTTLLLSLTFSPTTCASARVMPKPPTIHILNQQPLQQFPMQQQEPLGGDSTQTTTLHTTVTSYVLYSTITATLTRYTADETTAVPEAVQTWYAAQREEGCDRTACASCRVWYACEGFGEVW